MLAAIATAFTLVVAAADPPAPSPPVGTAVDVVVESGALAVRSRGRVTRCTSRDAAPVCAVLRNGRRVAGVMRDHKTLLVEVIP
jgi:hypothetical protein